MTDTNKSNVHEKFRQALDERFEGNMSREIAVHITTLKEISRIKERLDKLEAANTSEEM